MLVVSVSIPIYRKCFKVMGLFAFGTTTQIDRYRRLGNDERWDRMVSYLS
jgi:hypothetical protein